MAFPDDHRWKAPLTIASSEVSSTLTNFPVLLTAANLPSAMFDADGANPAQNGGGDIRFSSDADGATQLPCEVVSFVTDNNPANGTAEIHVKVTSVSSSVDTTIYVWWNTAGTDSQPAIDSTYGAENVWDSSYLAVLHMNQDPSGSAPQLLDSTANDNDFTSNGSMTTGDLVDGALGKGIDFDGTNDYLSKSSITGLTATQTKEFIIDGRTFTAGLNKYLIDQAAAGNNNWVQLFDSTGDGTPLVRAGFTATGSSFLDSAADVAASTDYHIAVTSDSATKTLAIYLQGALSNSGAKSNTATPAAVNIGRYGAGGNHYDDVISEFRLSSVVRSAAWIAATDSTLLTPGTFASAGSAVRTTGYNGPALLMQMIGI